MSARGSAFYAYDNVVPYCVRNNQSIYSIAGAGDYLDPDDLAAKVNAIRAGGNTADKTIVYEGDRNLSYTGIWTNQRLVGQGRCADDHSGCQSADPFIYEYLKNRQESWSTLMSDVATNHTAAMCTATVQPIKEVRQTCRYYIGADYIDTFLADPAAARLEAVDRAWLIEYSKQFKGTSNLTNHPAITTPNILRLRRILRDTTGKNYYEQNSNQSPKLFDFQ